MDFVESLKVSFGALRSNKMRAALTMLGVIIGVTAVIMLISLGEGAKKYIQDQFVGIGSNLLIITPGKLETRGGPFPAGETVHRITYGDAEAIKKHCRSVIEVVPVIIGASSVKYANRSRDTTVIGVTENFPRVRNLHVEIGSFFKEEDVDAKRRVVVLGRRVKTELFRESNPLGQWVSIGEMKFRVIGIMERKGVSLGFDIDDLVFIPVRTAQELFDVDRLFEIIAQAKSEKDVDTAKEEIVYLLSKRHDNNEDFTVTSQAAILSSLLTILDVFTWVLGGIAAISLLVGGVGIMNIMLVSVSERTKEIGVRKAVGARRGDIMYQFVIEAVVLSVSGGAFGILFGNLGAFGLRAVIPALPVTVSLWTVLLGFFFSAGVGIFFGVYPAYKASGLNPIDALRYE
ncbi:MAG: ABC transporter permease [Acidobacteriota bacterium]